MALSANGELDDAFGREIADLQNPSLIVSGDIVDAQSAALDLAPRFSVRCHQACPHERREHAQARFEFGARDFYGRKIFGDRAFFKRLPRGFRCNPGRLGAMEQRCRGVRERLLGDVDLGSLQFREPLNLVQRECGE